MQTPTTVPNQLRRIADRTLSKTAKAGDADLTVNLDKWQWHQGVALYGLLRAGEALGEEAYATYVGAWIDRHLGAGSPPKSINTTAPLLAVSWLHERKPTPAYRSVCDEFAAWCLHEAPRLPDGTFEHSCTDNRYEQQVWADTLFMGCIFLARWGRITGDRSLSQEAARQFVRHYEWLADESTGLIYHGYDGLSKTRKGVLWGRGNGWFAAASAEVLSLLDDSCAEKAAIRDNLERHLAGLVSSQGASGAWRTVMNEESTYEELSCTAAFAYALQLLEGQEFAGGEAIDRCKNKALACVLSEIGPEGELRRASGGTPVLADARAYNAIPYAITSFSQGLAMLALSASL